MGGPRSHVPPQNEGELAHELQQARLKISSLRYRVDELERALRQVFAAIRPHVAPQSMPPRTPIGVSDSGEVQYAPEEPAGPQPRGKWRPLHEPRLIDAQQGEWSEQDRQRMDQAFVEAITRQIETRKTKRRAG
jgi:hypothetical protein